ncbi:MAG: hypothetical protein V1815_00150 [Candidatus Woesearchaeota archaeon]
MLQPEELWAFRSREGSWERWNLLGLKHYIQKYPLCELYIDKISKLFKFVYNKEIFSKAKIDMERRIVQIKPITPQEDIKSVAHEIYHLVYNIGGGYHQFYYGFGGFEELIEKEVNRLYLEESKLMLYLQSIFGIPKEKIYENQLKLFN